MGFRSRISLLTWVCRNASDLVRSWLINHATRTPNSNTGSAHLMKNQIFRKKILNSVFSQFMNCAAWAFSCLLPYPARDITLFANPCRWEDIPVTHCPLSVTTKKFQACHSPSRTGLLPPRIVNAPHSSAWRVLSSLVPENPRPGLSLEFLRDELTCMPNWRAGARVSVSTSRSRGNQKEGK